MQKLALRIEELRDKAAKATFTQLVLDGGWTLETTPEIAFVFEANRYPVPANKLYRGKFKFSKHFYPVPADLEDGGEEWRCAMAIDDHPKVKRWVRNLDSDPVAGFWLPTSSGRFYPDFVCELNDGRVLVVEYKGTHISGMPKEIEKGEVGKVWAERSGGKALFAMVFKNLDGKNVAQQLDQQSMSNAAEKWERFLDPDVLRPSLLSATMFITAFELLKDSIVDRVRDFYTLGWGDKTFISPEYEQGILTKDKNGRPLPASLDWLREHDAINEADLQIFKRLADIRNQLAHELFSVVTGQVPSEYESHFPALIALLRKVEVWWIVNVEITTNPDYNGQEIDEDGITPGALISLQMLIEVASGSTKHLEQWRKISSPRK
jgi:Holliday junction resolvase